VIVKKVVKKVVKKKPKSTGLNLDSMWS